MHVSILESHVQKTGVGVCCGTFGELLQGIDADNKDFLVTFPINRYSKVYSGTRSQDSFFNF